jgi:hypothetical protein
MLGRLPALHHGWKDVVKDPPGDNSGVSDEAYIAVSEGKSPISSLALDCPTQRGMSI